MDVIWKHLSDNHRSCRRLSLYSQSDPGTGATFAVRCNSLVGVTSEENFLNDAMYLIEGVLPLNETLQTVEMEWSFLSHLEEEERDSFIRGVASLKNLEELSIRGVMAEESRIRFRSLLQIPECAKNLKHLAIELDQVHVEDPAEMGLAALLFFRCQHLESFHIRGLMPSPSTGGHDFDCSILLSALGKLPALHTIHISRNQENPKALNATALRDVCALPMLQSLSLMNMGLTDRHCKVFKRYLHSSRHLHSLILVDNPAITEKGNKALLRLLEKNRSIYNSTFGTDSETAHRTAQLVHLHLNRCGRSKVQTPTEFPDWLSYLSRINETVPEELELDTLFIAVQENPEMIVQHCLERDSLRQQLASTPKYVQTAQSEQGALCEQRDEGAKGKSLPTRNNAKKLPTRKDVVVLDDWESIFPLLTSRDSIDSIMSPPQPVWQQQINFLEAQVQEHQNESVAFQSPSPQELQLTLGDPYHGATKAQYHTNPRSFLSSPSCTHATDSETSDQSNLDELSSSWDGVVGRWVELERTTSTLFESFRDETCWPASLSLTTQPQPSSNS
ncbi:hypothetical protein ACA910_004163 [Epithemia clementina (nom. ined.)]